MSAVYSLFADFDAYGRTLPPHAPTESLLTGNVLAVVIASAVVHYGLYAFSRPDRLDAASRTRVASQFHAILSIAALAAWFWCYDVDPWDKANARRLTCVQLLGPLAPLPPRPTRALAPPRHGFEADGDHWFPIFTAVSSGYFVADTLAILSCKEAFDGQALVHHAIIGPAFLLGLHFRTLFPYQFFFLGEELSTVALNFKVGSSRHRRLNPPLTRSAPRCHSGSPPADQLQTSSGATPSRRSSC